MCDVCSGLLSLFESHDDRLHSGGGLRLGKNEILSVIQYVNVWPQKQCMCCYKEFKNFERFNNIVQIMLTVAIRHIQTLPEDYAKEKKEQQSEKDHEDDATLENSDNKDKVSSESSKPEEVDKNEAEEEHEETDEVWTMEERDQLFQLVTKVFLMNFPSYVAYKHVVHSSLEELSQQETRALNNYCEISDSEVPLYLLRNVCFFCDSNGVQALQQCFEKATPDTLPFTVAHTLINIIANLRLWMNIATVMQCIVPLRTAVIRYMCKLSDKDLRMAGTRNMTDLMWASVK